MTDWAVAPDTPTVELVHEVEAALGKRATEWRKPHTGITPAQRFVVSFDDGTSAFVKASVDSFTEAALSAERSVLENVDADFVPRLVHASDDLLITEDLSHAHWPADHPGAATNVTWLPGQIDALLATLDRVAIAAPDLPLPSAADSRRLFWPRIAADADAVASEEVLPRRWIDSLLAAEAECEFVGDALLHDDLRSDNVCFLGDRAVLVDWSNAARGNPALDRAELALTYAIEGGPEPDKLVGDVGPLPAWYAGLMLTRAVDLEGQAPDWLVAVFKRVAVIALDWSARCLGLG